MTNPERYKLLQALMLRVRALGTASDHQLDALLEEMDAAWDAMTLPEREQANARAAALAQIPAPDDLHPREVQLALGDHDLPRKAA